MEACIQWAKAREQFGVPIATKQSVHFMIADMAVEIEALRSLVYRTAWMIDTGQPHILEAVGLQAVWLGGGPALHRQGHADPRRAGLQPRPLDRAGLARPAHHRDL